MCAPLLEHCLLAMTSAGTCRDQQGTIDIGISRSIDGGCSWEPMRVAMQRGEWGGLPRCFSGISDACILVEKKANDSTKTQKLQTHISMSGSDSGSSDYLPCVSRRRTQEQALAVLPLPVPSLPLPNADSSDSDGDVVDYLGMGRGGRGRGGGRGRPRIRIHAKQCVQEPSLKIVNNAKTI